MDRSTRWGPAAVRPRWTLLPLRLLAPGLLALGLLGSAMACGGDQPVTDPRVLSLEMPFRYPVDLWDADVEGEVVVMVHVTDVGHVDTVYVLESSGVPAMDSAALDGARVLDFAPGRRGDHRVAMWAKLPVYFQKPDPEEDA